MKYLKTILLLAVLLSFGSAQSASVLIFDADVENDGDWVGDIWAWYTDGLGFLTPGVQEGTYTASLNQISSNISQTFGTHTLQEGTYTVEFAIGDYDNFAFLTPDINFTGMGLSDASVLSQMATPASGGWELWQVIWEVLPGNPNLGDQLSFAMLGLGSAVANLAFDGVGALSANGNGFLVSYDAAPVPLPPAVWLFASALGLLGWIRRKAT